MPRWRPFLFPVRLRPVGLVFGCVLAVGRGGAVPRLAHAGEGGERRIDPPAENVSYVPADDPALRKAFQAVADAVARGDALTTARTLQQIAQAPPAAVVAVAEAAGQAGVFESVTVVAHHRVGALGTAVADAYEREFGPRAAALLAQGQARRDPGLLADAFDRYAPTTAGRRAALLLVDLALERGDLDDALGWLDRLEDLEVTAAPEVVAHLAPWRAARLDRAARALAATPAAEPAIRARLATLAPGLPLVGGTGAATVAPDDVARPALPTSWPTVGGGPARAGVAAAVPDRLVRVADEELVDPRPAPRGEADERGRASRPSPWIPTRGVVDGDRLVVSDGRRLHVLSLTTHKLRSRAPIPLRPDDATAPPALRGVEARRTWGLVEGFGLAIDGDVVYANVPAEVGTPDPEPLSSPFSRAARGAPPVASRWLGWDDAVSAVRLTDDGGTVLWVAGGGARTPGLPERLRLVGTPLVYRGAVHVAGIRATASTDDLFEAWHVALSPRTGAVRSAVFLGTGTPLRRKRVDEAMPAGCVGAHGRVHVVTSLGLASAVDARTGRTLWSFRYDRGRPDGEDTARRLTADREGAERRSSFANHPPVVVDGRLYVAPTDGRSVWCLSDRPRGRDRLLTRWPLHRTDDVRNLALEQVVGVTDGRDGVPPTLVVVGQGYGVDPLHDPFTVVVAVDALSGRLRWERALPFGALPEPLGVAVIAGDDVFVPTAKGIARYALADGADRPSIVADGDDDDEAYGNLVPVPGRGLVAVAASRVTFWMRPPKK